MMIHNFEFTLEKQIFLTASGRVCFNDKSVFLKNTYAFVFTFDAKAL